jgi:hypothetical protein
MYLVTNSGFSLIRGLNLLKPRLEIRATNIDVKRILQTWILEEDSLV